MKKGIMICIIGVLLIFLLDFIKTNNRINNIEESLPQLTSALEGCIISYLRYDSTVSIDVLNKSLHESIMLKPDLIVFRKIELSVESIPNLNYSYPITMDIIFERESVKKKHAPKETIHINDLNYWDFRIRKTDILLTSLGLSDVLTRWIKNYSINEIESLSIGLEFGRHGGKISGKIVSIIDDRVTIQKGNWLILSPIPSSLNYLKGKPDSCIVQGLIKNKNLSKLELIFDPAIVYNIGDSAFYKE